jgi:L-amino acid N-acyltransferase YncA
MSKSLLVAMVNYPHFILSSVETGTEVLGVEKFLAKIGFDNEPSIHLFTKLGFTEVRSNP